MRLAAAAQAVVAAAALAFAAPAYAQTATGELYAPGQGSPTSGSLKLDVTASIQSTCEFGPNAPNGSYAVPELNNAWSKTFTFNISCSSNFRVGIESINGALVVSGNPTVESGYTDSAPYNVDLVLNGSSGAADSGLCAVSNIGPSGSASACNHLLGPATGNQGLELLGGATTAQNSTVTVSGPSHSLATAPVLIQSTGYTDTLTVTIAAAS